MKNLNLIKRLWTDSHEKQSPQRFGRFAAILIMLLTLGVGQMLADSYIDEFSIQFYEDGSTNYYKGNGDIDNGTKMSFGNKTCDWTISYIYANIKKNGENVCEGTWFGYQIFGNTGTSWANSNKYGHSWGGDYHYTYWGAKDNSSSRFIELVKNRLPGDYNLQFVFGWNAGGDCKTDRYCKYSDNNWKFSWTIPDPTIEITGVSSLVAGTAASISASISSYPVGATLTNLAVAGNVASTVSKTGTGTSISSLAFTPNASGNNGITVTVTVTYGSAGTKDYVYYYNVTPPAVSDFTITPSGSGYLSSGSGTSVSPYLVTYNGAITFSLSGADDSKAYDDANSTAQYSIDGSSYGTASSNTSKTHSSVTQTTNQNWVYRAKLKNKSAALYGAIKEKTVYWKVPTYTVTLDKNSGSTGGSATATHGMSTLSISTSPSKTGYHVEGYYESNGSSSWGKKVSTDAGALQASTAYTDASNKWNSLSNQTIYTKWEANTWYVQFHGNGNDGGSMSNESFTYDADAKALTSCGFTKTGYHFYGWATSQVAADAGTRTYTDGATVRNLTTSPNGIVHLYAIWEANKYDINLDNQGGSNVTVGLGCLLSNKLEVTFGTKYFDCYIDAGEYGPTTKIGYEFGGWYSGEGGTGDQILDESGQLQSSTVYTDSNGKWNHVGNVTVYAKWTMVIAGLVYINSDKEGLYTPGTMTMTYNSGTINSFTAASKNGYTLQGYWTAASDGSKVINANGTLVSSITDWTDGTGKWVYNGSTPDIWAHFNANTYTVAFAKNDDPSYYSGTDTGSDPANITATYDETFTFPANPYTRTNYHFIGWSRNKAQGADYPSNLDYDYEKTAGSTGSNYTTTQGATVTFYAKWRGDVHTVSFNPRGGDVLGSSSKSVNYGAAYGDLPEASKSGGYEFAGWYTEPDGAGSLVTAETIVSATSDHTVYAHYTKVDRVYFKNTLGWSNVYVTWDAEWNHDSQNKGAGSMGKTQELMSRIIGTDIWYIDIPSSILSSWSGNIAFTNTEMQDAAWFYQGEAVFRRDFSELTTMFVPNPKDPNKFNMNKVYDLPGTDYYSTATEGDATYGKYKNGYWVSYNDVKAQYTLKGDWDSWTADHYIERPTTSDSVYIYKITGLSANRTYQFKLWKLEENNNTGTVFSTATLITSTTAADAAIFNAANSANAQFTTTVAGDYMFKFNFSNTGAVKLTIVYPFGVNDYKVVYSYNKGGAQTFESEYIKARPNGKDTISMFIHSEDSVTASSRSLYLQKCTNISAGSATWNTTYASIAFPEETASSEGDDVTSGVYNFVITQNEGGTSATGAPAGKYEGDYYIRTACADGGWDLYKYRGDNVMTLSEYSLKQTIAAPFSHYFCKYIGGDEIPITTDITYTVATKYSPKICPILEGDATIGVGNKVLLTGNPASVRFSWNEQTNVTRRAYLKSAQGTGNTRYLVMHGADNKLRNSAGNEIAADVGASLAANELLFTDKGNWIYELEIKALPGAKVSILAQYNSVDRPLVGNADASQGETLISGSSATAYPMRAVYDFKTNRLMTAWTPSGTITDALSNVDVLIERHNQDGATTITFGKASAKAAAGSITAKRVIGALRFDYTELVGNVAFWTPETRGKMMFFVSFPFDVNISDIFGLNSAYGEAYIVQKYNGALRAEKGFFLGDGTTSFWEILPVDSVMHAGVGYVVTMDNDYLNNDKGHVWDNKSAGDHVYLYFPSATPVTINSDAKTITVPAHECKIDRTFGKLNHKYTDSNWNLMGVPIFQNHTGNATEGTPGAIFTASEEPSDTTDYKEHPDLGYFYQWETDKNYTIRSAVGFTFKPMHSYMVQYAGDVKFTCAEPVSASVAARRTPMTENYNIDLQVLNSNDEMLNHTYVELRENAVDTFAVNEDTYMLSNSKDVNVYTFAGAYDVAANVLSIGSHVVPVGVIVNRAGTYTFSMPSNFSGSVTLVDKFAQTRTNLNIEDYEIHLPAGTIDDRFELEININKVPTAIDGVEASRGSLKDGKAHKFIMNDMMYILKDGVLYDARGNRVK